MSYIFRQLMDSDSKTLTYLLADPWSRARLAIHHVPIDSHRPWLLRNGRPGNIAAQKLQTTGNGGGDVDPSMETKSLRASTSSASPASSRAGYSD